MATDQAPLIGEFLATIDSEHRLTLPQKFQVGQELSESSAWVLAKERVGTLGLWAKDAWESRLGGEIATVCRSLGTAMSPSRFEETRRLMRLLSARSQEIKVSPKGRLTIPAECREFLGVKVPGTCVVVGTGASIELWAPDSWNEYLKGETANFSALLERLTT